MRCKPLSLLFGVGVLTILSTAGLLLRRGELRFSSSHLSLGKAGSIGIVRGQLSLWKFSQWSEENNLTRDLQQQGSDLLQVHEKSGDVDVVLDEVRATATEDEKEEAERNFNGKVGNTARLSELVPISETHLPKEEGDEQRLAVDLVLPNEADETKETLGAKTNNKTATSQTDRKLIQDKISPGKGVHLNMSAGSHNFTIRPTFSLPVPLATLPLSQLLHTHWLQALKNFLNSLNPHSGPVTIVSSDYSYREVLLNWLISAHVRVDRPLSNVLVLSLDASLYTLLKDRGVACIHIPPHSLLSSALIAGLTKHIGFTQSQVSRLTVTRFIIHWGFDVALYDTDAIILKNPELLYYKQYGDSDIIGTYGHFPQQIMHEWGIAICIGVAMFKSTTHTEGVLERMNQVLRDIEATSDQARLNTALKGMDIIWNNGSRTVPISNEAWRGIGRGGLTLTVLPSVIVCRQHCSRHLLSSYYVWHKGGKRNRDGKRKYAAGPGLWYLRADWMAVSNRTTDSGFQWLKAIAN